MTNLFSKLGRVASRAGRVFKPRHGIKHYARKHSGHAGLIAAGVGIGAASDLAIDAIKGEQEVAPPIYYMEGGEDAVNTIIDDSWNLIKLSEIQENFSESTIN